MQKKDVAETSSGSYLKRAPIFPLSQFNLKLLIHPHQSSPTSFSFSPLMEISLRHRFSLDLLHCRSAAKWTVLLTLTAAVVSFAPEFIFANATSLSSSFSKSCRRDGYIRIPLDLPGDVLCLPAKMVNRSSLDFFVPTVFAALSVGVSACFVRLLGLWENTEISRFNHS